MNQSLPFDGRPYTISIGVRRLDLTHWLDLDARSELLAKKALLLREHHSEVVATIPGSEHGSWEVLELVQAELALHGIDPGVRATSELSDLHPIDQSGRLVGEDLCLMEQRPDRGDGYFLTAASVCFPSRWSLSEKIGTSLSSIHAPVPDYSSIGTATDRFFDAITVERPAQRVNWTLIDDPALFQPTAASRDRDRSIDPKDIGQAIYLRVERQTIRRLPTSGGVLFTIGTEMTPVLELTHSERFVLAQTLQNVAEDVASYKGWKGIAPDLMRWLSSAN